MKINKKALFGIMASLVSILVGLLLGLILLFVFDSSRALVGFEALVTTGISTTDKLAKVLYQAAPLILTGLSVAFAFKTGLFNIGAPGQYTIGSGRRPAVRTAVRPETLQQRAESPQGSPAPAGTCSLPHR